MKSIIFVHPGSAFYYLQMLKENAQFKFFLFSVSIIFVYFCMSGFSFYDLQMLKENAEFE